ncbi:(2Fe-2S)-binding protein [Desulforhopalus sp. 52FAK]
MFIPIDSRSNSLVTIQIEGKKTEVPEGISVAAAVFGHANHKDCRCSSVSGEQRAPYCFIGVCHECLMEIDGKPNQQACLTQVNEGMCINKQRICEGE